MNKSPQNRRRYFKELDRSYFAHTATGSQLPGSDNSADDVCWVTATFVVVTVKEPYYARC